MGALWSCSAHGRGQVRGTIGYYAAVGVGMGLGEVRVAIEGQTVVGGELGAIGGRTAGGGQWRWL